MKNKHFLFLLICVILILAAVVGFFIFGNNNGTPTAENDSEGYDVSAEIEAMEFLKFDTVEEIKAYAEEYPIYIMTSDDTSIFGIGEWYIEGAPVSLFYTLADDGSVYRFDGLYEYAMSEPSVERLSDVLRYVETLLMEFFHLEQLEVTAYDDNGLPLGPNDADLHEKMLEAKATYAFSMIDYDSSYWNVSVRVAEQNTVQVEFFRCFDEELYDDEVPNVDLRSVEESGE